MSAINVYTPAPATVITAAGGTYPVSLRTPLVISGGTGLNLSRAATAARASTAAAFAPLVRALSGAEPGPNGLILPPGYVSVTPPTPVVVPAAPAVKVAAKALYAPLLAALGEAGSAGVAVAALSVTLGVSESGVRNAIDYARRVGGPGAVVNVGRGVFALPG